ncbi:MAG: HRDC domain-containing protein, partial [Acidimicrobiales bacterium]
SKGLEWQVVFLAGLERGLVPIGHAASPADEAEERRLLYVAMTRARVDLHCSWAERRTFGARTLHRRSSPYMDAIKTACQALSDGLVSADIGHLVEARARLAPAKSLHRSMRPADALAEDADPEILRVLREWRSSTARASGVPAYVIFHDTTLAALATAKPSSHQELLSLPGMGPVKAARYGDTIISLVSGSPASA